MTIEDKLKEFIIEKHGSILAFSNEIGLPNSTMMGILKRGVHNSSISNIITVCNALHISVDALAVDLIVEIPSGNENKNTVELYELLQDFKAKLKTYDSITVKGNSLTKQELKDIEKMISLSYQFMEYKKG